MIEVSFPKSDGTSSIDGDVWVCLATKDGKPGECSKLGNGIRFMWGRPMHPGTITVGIGAPGGVHIALGEYGGAVALVRSRDGEPLMVLDYTTAMIGPKCVDAIRLAATKKK